MKMNIYLKVFLIVIAAVYIISPVDALPGPVDDIIIAILTAYFSGRQSGREKYRAASESVKALDEVLVSLKMNAANNYKDAAQADYRKAKKLLEEMKAEGAVADSALQRYEQEMAGWDSAMEGFTHKDQKPDYEGLR